MLAQEDRDEAPWRLGYRRVLIAIPLGILALEIATIAWASAIGNRQLFKDGVDWTYDVILYGVAAAAFGLGGGAERATAALVGAVMFIAGAHTLWDLADKIANPRPIEPFILGFSAVSAILVALLILAGLWRYRRIDNPLTRATWLSSRNDAISTTFYSALNLAARTLPDIRWPEYALDLFSAALAFQAAAAVGWTIWRQRRGALVGASQEAPVGGGQEHGMKGANE
jgi:Co/Zn/Cd efflux system component